MPSEALDRRVAARAALHSRRIQFLDGVRHSLPLCVALAPIGLAFGYGARAVHLSWWLATLMSALVYSSPSQFLALPLIGIGAGVPAIVATTFVSNLRYVLFGASLAPLVEDASTASLVVNTHGIADGNYALTVQRAALDPERPRKDLYLLGSFVVLLGVWVPATIAGALIPGTLPALLGYGLGFADAAIFIGFLVPAVRDLLGVCVVALAGAGTLLGNRYLPPGAGSALAIVGAAFLGGVIRWRREERSS